MSIKRPVPLRKLVITIPIIFPCENYASQFYVKCAKPIMNHIAYSGKNSMISPSSCPSSGIGMIDWIAATVAPYFSNNR